MQRGWVYAWDALGTFAKQGAAAIEFWCVTPGCVNRDRLPISTLIERYGAETSLIMLARKARCRFCKRRGCHVQPAPPPVQGQPGYHKWVEQYGAR